MLAADKELLVKIRRIWNAQNQAETDEEFEKLEAEVVPLIAEMDRRGLQLKDMPASNEVD